MTDEARVAELLQQGLTALREQRPADAAPPLHDAWEALEHAEELQDFAARVASLLAQAHLEQGEAAQARTFAHQALRRLRSLADEDGLAQVRALDEQIGAALEATRRDTVARAKAAAYAEQTTEAIELLGQSPLARADALLKHVDSLRRVGQTERAIHSAERALHWADATREQVLAHLALAELGVDPEPHLHRALAIADGADETTLVGLIAKAAELAGVTLPATSFADRPTERG